MPCVEDKDKGSDAVNLFLSILELVLTEAVADRHNRLGKIDKLSWDFFQKFSNN